MEKHQSVIRLNYTDRDINQLLKDPGTSHIRPSKHFNQNEEFFLKTEGDYLVPSVPIHHDVHQKEPSKPYLDSLKDLLAELVPAVPDIFAHLTYFFDPTDILRPRFFQLYRLAETHYVYLLKLDLSFRAAEHQIVERSTNDATASYRTNKLFLEGLVIPLDGIDVVDGKVAAFNIKQTVSQTWIGETGRGYFVQGIWMDHELTKFFSKLFVARGVRIYPFYPFQCRYRTICSTVIDMSADGRRKNPPLLHRALQFVGPQMERIQESVRNVDFSEDLPAFVEMKRNVPESWNQLWNGMTVKPYLNEHDMKEFVIED